MKTKKLDLSKHSFILLSLTLVLLIGIAYMGALNAPFIMDDIWAIRDNPRVGDPGLIFERPLGFMRPLMIHISYTLGGLEPFYYHIFNLIFHFGTAMFLFLIVRRLIGERPAWFASVLFAVHPILSETVIWISALPTPQYSFLLMVSLFAYITHEKTKKRRWYYITLFFCALSILSAEQAVALPLIIVLTEISFFSLKKNWKRVLPFLLIVGIKGGMSLMNIGPRLASFESDFYTKRVFYNPLVHLPYSISSYLELMVFPKNLTIYHADIAISWFALILRWIVLILFIIAIVYSFKKRRPVFFGLMFFILALSPTLIPINIVWMVAERYVYLGTAGIVIVIGYLLSLIADRKKYATAVYVVVIVAVALFLMRTTARVTDWQTEDDFWVATVQTSPTSPNAHNNMGYVYSKWGDDAAAIKEYKMATLLKPDYGDAYHNMAVSYAKVKQYELAIESLNNALKYNPRLWQSHQNLAALYYQRGDRERGRAELLKAISIVPENNQLRDILREMDRRSGT